MYREAAAKEEEDSSSLSFRRWQIALLNPRRAEKEKREGEGGAFAVWNEEEEGEQTNISWHFYAPFCSSAFVPEGQGMRCAANARPNLVVVIEPIFLPSLLFFLKTLFAFY